MPRVHIYLGLAADDRWFAQPAEIRNLETLAGEDRAGAGVRPPPRAPAARRL